MTELFAEGIGLTGDDLLTAAPLYITGDVYYVSSAGDDGWNGTAEDTPFLTLAAAIAVANDGDNIIILSGYTETRTTKLDITQNDLTIVGVGSASGVPTVAFSHNAAENAGVSLTGDRILLANVTFKPATQANTSGRLQVVGNNCTLRNVRVECGQHDAVALYLAPVAEGDGDRPGVTLDGVTVVSTATTTATRPTLGATLATAANTGRLDMSGVVLDNGTVGFTTCAFSMAASSSVHVRCTDLSLLRGADIILQSGNTGYVHPATVTGGGRVRWS